MARQGEYGSMSPACDMTYHGKRGCTACEAVRSARPKTQRKGAAPSPVPRPMLLLVSYSEIKPPSEKPHAFQRCGPSYQ